MRWQAAVRKVALVSLVVPLVSVHSSSSAEPRRTAVRVASVVPTAALAVERMAHTATVLTTGDILVAGGFTAESEAHRSAELYSPAARLFRPLSRMVTPRHSHTATRLADGSVLIAGGYTASGQPVADVERYDPVRRTFSAVGRMREPRSGHTAQLLRNGSVLFVGGVGPNWHFLSSAEVYDPIQQQSQPVGAMQVPRESHVAVTLNDGRVLIVGGHSGRRSAMQIYTSAELFDPATRRFTAAGHMRVRRHKHDAVRTADGRVLVTGGSDERDDRGAYTSTEWYDPRTGTFSLGPSMQLARYKHERSSVLLPGGQLLIAGGAAAPEVLDLRTQRFTTVASRTPLAGQFSASALMPNGRVLITGGYGNGAGPRALAWEYVP
jgi:hypothetical protein